MIDAPLPVAFSELFKPHRYKVFYGGRGGAKSRSFARALLLIGTQRAIRCLCAREVQNSIREKHPHVRGEDTERLFTFFIEPSKQY